MKNNPFSLQTTLHAPALWVSFNLLLLALLPCAAANDPPAVAALTMRVAVREKRAELILGELRASDGRIEERIEDMIIPLQSVADSKDSRTKVVRMKERTIEELRKSIVDCARKRATLQEELRRPTLNLTAEQKRRGIAAFDGQIERRITQIMELYNTLPRHKDYEQYKALPGGWYGQIYIENQDWKQNRMVVSHTNATRSKLADGFRASIRRLEKQSRDLQTQLSSVKEETQRAALLDEMMKNEEVLLKRREQMAEIFAPMEDTNIPGITLRQALTLDKALDEAVAGLRHETDTLFKRFSEYVSELIALNSARAELAAAQAAASGGQATTPR